MKTAINLNEYEKVNYWMSIPLGNLYSWIDAAVEVAEERKKAQGK